MFDNNLILLKLSIFKFKIFFKHYTKVKNYLVPIKRFKIKFKRNYNNFLISSKQEYKETKIMIKVFFSKKPTKEELIEAKKQFKDLLKISSLRPILILPGSPITLPLFYKIAKKFNIDLTPSSFKYNFLKIGVETNEKNLKVAKKLLQYNLDITQYNFKLYKYFKRNNIEFNDENIKLYNIKYNIKNNNLKINDDDIINDIYFKYNNKEKI